MKKLALPLLSAIACLFCIFHFSCGPTQNEHTSAIRVFLNGAHIEINTLLYQEKIYVPADEICYYFKCDFSKDDSKKTIDFIRSRSIPNKPERTMHGYDDVKSSIPIRKNDYHTMIDGLSLYMTPIVYDEIFYIPLAYFAESFEKNTVWNPAANSVEVNDYPEEYVGSVNGEKIKKRFFNERFLSELEKQKGVSSNAQDDQKDLETKRAISKDQEIQLREKAFAEVVTMILAAQKARDYGIILDDTIKKKINHYLGMAVSKFGGIDGFRAKFDRVGVTYQDAINYFTYGVIKDALMEKIAANAQPPEEMMRAYYDNSPEIFKRPAMALVKHILIPVRGKDNKEFSKQKKEEQRNLAETLRKRISNGEDFEKLRVEYSQDYYPDTKDHPNGFEVEQGYLAIAKVFEDAVFRLKPGEMSPVVSTYRGFHIIKLLSKTEEKHKTFEESKERIRRDLAYTAKANYVDDIINEWKKQSKIVKQL